MGSDLERLRHWEASGGTWEILARRPSGAVDLALLTCQGDQEMGRLHSEEPELIAYVAAEQ